MLILRSLWAACICGWLLGLSGHGAPPEGPALPLQYLRPLAEPPGPSTRRGPIVLSEVMYHPAARTDGRKLQFIELFNSQVFFEDLSGWSLRGDVEFTFPTNTVLPARGYLVVAANPVDLRAVYPELSAAGAVPVLGPFDRNGALSHGSGTLRLHNQLGAVVFELNYRSDLQWPVAADGGGPSLALARPSYGERHPYAWGPSEVPGGSPGGPEPARSITAQEAIVINEILAHSTPPARDFVELFNYSEAPVDLSGCILTDDPTTNRFVIPAGTKIPARGHVSWDQSALGFGLSSAGEQLFLYSSNRVRVLDAIQFDAQESGIAWGRYPDGAAQFLRLQSPTPSAPNAAALVSPVVLNEIMYHPASELVEDEYVEIHNQSPQAVDLAGWRIEEGAHFTFPAGTVIPPNGYFVIARNLASLSTNYPTYNPATWFGDFTGSLSGAGERLTLTKPSLTLQTNRSGTVSTTQLNVVVDEVTYGTGGRWGRWADGGGSSLERRDPRADGRQAANWADSDETRKSPWVTLQATGPSDLGNSSADALQILSHGAGEYLIDDVVAQVGAGTNRVVNSSFDTGTAGWTFQGNHLNSIWEPTEGSSAPGCLRLRANGAGTTGPNRAYTRVTAIAAGNTVTLRARVRWLRGAPAILFRIKGNYMEIPGYALAARNLGTPGAPNTARLPASVPNITEVSHFPILPRSSEVVRITARIQDPAGVETVVLRYHSDTTTTAFNTLTMTNSGAGWYSAELPPLSGLQQFHLVVTNSLGRVTLFPSDAPDRECNIRYGDPLQSGALGQYRMWVSKTNVTRWTKRHALANDPLDTTFVYGSARAIYNAGSQYSGSPYHAPGYNSPTGNNCDYVVVLPPDDPFLGETELNLLQPGNGGSDPTVQGEQQAYWIARQIGLPNCHRRSILVWFNGTKRGVAYDDAQQPNGDFIRQWYPDDDQGDLRKIQLWFEFEADGSTFNAVGATLDNFVSQGKKKLARYRWNWPRRSYGNDPNNFTNIYALVDAVTTKEVTDRYTRVLEQATDVSEWFRTHVVEHLVGNNDSYSYGGGQNMYAYKPERGPWQLLIWDIDFAFASADPSSDMTSIGGSNVGPVNSHPPFARKYYQAMIDALRGPLDTNRFNAILDARYNGLRANGAQAGSPSSIKTFLRSRRDFISRLITNNTAPLALNVSLTNGVTSGINLVTLSGTAPLDARALTLDGQVIPVTWTTRSAWTARVPFPSGTNVVTLGGIDGRGLPLTNPPVAVRVIVTAPDESPVGRILISEILPQPASALSASWIELQNTSFSSAFDLSGWRLEGLNYSVPPGTVLAAGGRLVIPSSRYLFGQTYGPQLPVAGEFAGRLDPAGETLRLMQPASAGTPERIINEMRYGTVAPWPEIIPGTALQLIDTAQDNRRPANWLMASKTSLPTDWLRVSATLPATSSTVYLYLENAGDVYIDDWSLVAGPTAEVGPNQLAGGDFEGAFPGAFLVGSNHAASTLTTGFAHSGTHSLHLVADSPGSTRGSALTLDLPVALTNGAEYTLSFWYRPKADGGLVSSRFSGGTVKATAELDGAGIVTGAPATPGTGNTGARPLPPLYALALNEIMPVNTATLRDNRDRFRPWVEIYNAGNTDQSLSDCFLSPTPENLAAWRFPAGSMVPAKGFLVVWLDGDTTASSAAVPHASFAIEPAGTLILSQLLEGRVGALDQLSYEDPGPDRSYGDIPDGDLLRRRVFSTPTPGRINSAADPAARVVINEWLADNANVLADPADGDFEDWFELYNSGTLPVNLGGYFLSNSRDNPTRFPIPVGRILPAGGHLLVWADDEASQNGTNQTDLHVDFKLSKAGDTIVFAGPDGTILDAVTFAGQSRNVSQGREPDGGAAVGNFAQPTPGLANPATAAPARITRVEPAGNQVALAFAGAPLRRYGLQVRTNLIDTTAGWRLESSTRTDAVGQGQFVSPLAADAPVNFYRLVPSPGDF